VQPSTSYCGGHATSQIVLASNDTWTDGEVSGASSGSQSGAVVCGTACTLVNMYIHDNPKAFAGIYVRGGSETAVSMTIIGGRVTGNGSLGIGGGGVPDLTITGVEIDHNGATANCGSEGGGFKGVNDGSRFTGNYVHDNNCVGVWYDVSADNNEIDHNRVDNNADGGIFYEISFNASIHDNEVSGNGFQANGNGCVWLWGAGIGIASSGGVKIYNNVLTNNCNGVGETQQNRGNSSIRGGPIAVGTPYLLQNVSVTGNAVSGTGRIGAAEDNGSVLSTRNLTWSTNTLSNGMTFCGLSC
jgi:parallel beta-helix repeat protein